jgi:threonyl-tRNA synthetase
MGSVERFVGILTEHFAGAFPTWLAPVQARILTVTDAQEDFARQCRDVLQQAGVRVEADLRNEKLGYKVREAQMEKIPYALVIGDQEAGQGSVNVRARGGKTLGVMSVDAFELLRQECEEPFKHGGMRYSFSN